MKRKISGSSNPPIKAYGQAQVAKGRGGGGDGYSYVQIEWFLAKQFDTVTTYTKEH